MLGWKLSKHAKDRKNERKVSDDDIINCLKRLDNTDILSGTYNLHYNNTKIVINYKDRIIITAINKDRGFTDKCIVNGKVIILNKKNEYIYQFLWDKEKSKMKNNKKIAKAKRVQMYIDIYND